MSMDFFKQMQDHVITCKKCTDLCFCEEAEAILRGEFPNVITLPLPSHDTEELLDNPPKV